MNITLRQLSYFKVLAHERHFGRAAERAHISQPALSVQIRELETTLGHRLVERRPREIVITPFGRRVLASANRVLDEVRALEETARWQDGLAGRLTLGIIPTIAPYILPAALERLRSADVLLDVRVQEGKTDRLTEMLRAGDLDAIIMALPVPGDGLTGVALFEDRFMLAGNAARLDAMGSDADKLRPDKLGRTPLLLLEDGHCLTDQALEICQRDRKSTHIDTGASSLPTLSRLVAAGFGLTLMPELAALTERRAAPQMRLMRFSGPEPSRRIGLVRRATSAPEGWFTELATVFGEVGTQILAEVRHDLAASD